MSTAFIDITPTPRILRTLGDIPLANWRCFAELIDNSIDAFAEERNAGRPVKDAKIEVIWSHNAVDNEHAIEITDNGPGMTLERLQNAARAGYSSNDPIKNLGLFGMGFNISTARLGEKTRLLSATKNSKEWVGIEIDFAELIKSKTFNAPTITLPKKNPGESGTKVTITKLKDGVRKKLNQEERSIREQLDRIYTTILLKQDVEICVQNKPLSPFPHCTWAPGRYVYRKGQNIHAIIEIDRDLGSALFDQQRNRYLTKDEEADLQKDEQTGAIPTHIIRRHKRLTGWVGLQRYADPNEFGIDFVRNGRKILLGDKSLFSYVNPLTGTLKLEYPVELGTTQGGRIVGELNVDYLLPTYQKDNFDRNDPSWDETVEAVRGVGPILPQYRKSLDFPNENESPLGILINAFRRLDPGTKTLSISKRLSQEFLRQFREGKPEFQNDDRWWKAAQEEDAARASGSAGATTPVNPGSDSTDNPEDYLPEPPAETPTPPAQALLQTPPNPNSTLDQLLKNSEKVIHLTKDYSYDNSPPFKVTAHNVGHSTPILVNGQRLPCVLFEDGGTVIDFFFDPNHPFLAQFPVSPEQLLAIHLSEKFNVRDRKPNLIETFVKLTEKSLGDLRIDRTHLQERAEAIFKTIRTGILECMVPKASAVIDLIHTSAGETEETMSALITSDSSLAVAFQAKSAEALPVVMHTPSRTLVRIVEKFPENLFDGQLFNSLYQGINLSDAHATERIRTQSKERIISYLKDALWVTTITSNTSKEELIRCSHSLTFLESETQ